MVYFHEVRCRYNDILQGAAHFKPLQYSCYLAFKFLLLEQLDSHYGTSVLLFGAMKVFWHWWQQGNQPVFDLLWATYCIASLISYQPATTCTSKTTVTATLLSRRRRCHACAHHKLAPFLSVVQSCQICITASCTAVLSVLKGR